MRYSRQIIFEYIGKEKQELLHKSKITIVGCGGLGTRTAELLARAGIVEITIIDKDQVELSNLQRQSLFREDDVGKHKSAAAKEELSKINSSTKVNAIIETLDRRNVDILNCDLILDCTDNLETRFVINDYCAKNKIPWIYSAVIGSGGMVMNVLPRRDYCFRCVVKESECKESCETRGILNSAAAVVSAIQATEAMKILTKQPCENGMININLWPLKLTKINVKRNISCPTCEGKYEYI